MNYFNCPQNWCKYAIIFAGIIIAVLIGLLDFKTGNEVSFSIFYLIPIILVVWYSNKYLGIVMAFFSASIWLYAESSIGKTYSNQVIQYWNAGVRFGFFTIIVFLLSAFKKLQTGLEEIVKLRTEELSLEIQERMKAEKSSKEKSEKLSQLAKKIQTVKEEENSRIARELHDELGQSMTAIKIELAWLARKNSSNTALAESLVSLTGVIDNTIDTIQKINSRLRPKLLDELGLFPAIDRFVREFQSKTGVRCQFTYPENGISINKIQASSLYRIFQEAMTNISKHSKATSIIINIFVDKESNLVLDIKDNGIGLKKNWNESPNSLGILGMNERAEMSGGEFYITSEINKGTEVTAVIPLGNKESQKND